MSRPGYIYEMESMRPAMVFRSMPMSHITALVVCGAPLGMPPTLRVHIERMVTMFSASPPPAWRDEHIATCLRTPPERAPMPSPFLDESVTTPAASRSPPTPSRPAAQDHATRFSNFATRMPNLGYTVSLTRTCGWETALAHRAGDTHIQVYLQPPEHMLAALRTLWQAGFRISGFDFMDASALLHTQARDPAQMPLVESVLTWLVPVLTALPEIPPPPAPYQLVADRSLGETITAFDSVTPTNPA